MRNLAGLLFILAVCINSSANFQIIWDVIDNQISQVIGVSKGVINAIPSVSEAADLAKQAILGLPFKVLLSIADDICSLGLSQGGVKTYYPPNINEIQFQFRTACNKYSYPVLEVENIVNNDAFDVSKKTVIVVVGWLSDVNSTYPKVMDNLSKAYNCRGDYNFLALDDLHYLQTLYTWAAVNTQLLGQFMGVGLQNLAKVVPYESIHLIGHSLGAHLVGAAGRHFTKLTGKKLKHITGLDPAKPCFSEGERLKGIYRGDADFVDIIHTTPGSVGQEESKGDADFYAGGLRTLQPGCFDIVCSHMIVADYYAESVYPYNENNFMASRCNSLKALKDGHCPGEKIPMGFAVPHDAIGNYFLEVNAEEPYGENSDGDFQSSTSGCGNCPTQEA